MGRIAAALQTIINTLAGVVVSVVTLPFRVLSHLIGGGRRPRRTRRRVGVRR